MSDCPQMVTLTLSILQFDWFSNDDSNTYNTILSLVTARQSENASRKILDSYTTYTKDSLSAVSFNNNYIYRSVKEELYYPVFYVKLQKN